MAKFIFKFNLRIGQCQVKLGEIKANFKNQNFLTEVCLSCPVLSPYSKNVIYFDVRQLEMPKITFPKSVVINSVFFYHCTAKNKDIASKFVMRRLHVVLQHIFYYWINPKF